MWLSLVSLWLLLQAEIVLNYKFLFEELCLVQIHTQRINIYGGQEIIREPLVHSNETKNNL
jgi:hypothetical protein